MTATSKPTRFVVELDAGPGDSRPPATRLRLLLKLASRSCGLRCVRAIEVPAKATAGES